MTNINKVIPFYYSLSGDTEEDKKLLEPFEYISRCVKTHVHTKFTLAFNYWLKISSDKLQQIDEIINIVYNVCILFDDIQDNSILRERFPAAHSVYGICNTINAANYVQLIAFEKISNLHPAATQILTEQLLEFSRGQGMDMYWKDNFICPTEKDYKIMAVRKSAWLIKMTVRLMKLFSTYEGDFSPLLNVMGFYYQIYNDYINLCTSPKDVIYCDDLTEGKFSFPIIHALTSNPDDRQILNIMKQRTKNIEMKHYCIELLESFGSFKYTRDILEELSNEVKMEIERLGGNPILLKMLNEYKKKMPNPYICEPLN